MTSPVVLRFPALTENQRALLASPARVLWVGAGTKTGKTVALAIWVAQGFLAGERCAWVGPWHRRTRSAYEVIKALLDVPLRRGDVAATDSTMRLSTPAGGRVEFLSGDNPEAIYGEGFHRVVIDEASRQTETSLTAALTTISATGGRVRLAFNLERGARNWAIRHLLRVRHLTPEERARGGEDAMTFPTAPEGFVDRALIDSLRDKMPEAMWRALYEAEIPDEDVALFRNLDEVFTGAARPEPVRGRHYVAGVDLARKQDWTVVTVMDARSGDVVHADRFNQLDWGVQVERVAAICRRFQVGRAYVDATGLGDVVVDELRRQNVSVEPVIFTRASRKELIEGLIVACDRRAIRLPPALTAFREEMEAVEFQLSEAGEVRYGVPHGFADDCLMSLALAVRGLRSGSVGPVRYAPPEPADPAGPAGYPADFWGDPRARDRAADLDRPGPWDDLAGPRGRFDDF